MISPDCIRLIKKALKEDIGKSDITTKLLIPPTKKGCAYLVAKEKGIISGIEVARQTFFTIDSSLIFEIVITNGKPVNPGDLIAKVSGNISSILTAERVALNFLQHLSGIASTTAQYVKAVEGLAVIITDTRKTLPGLRELQKEAVRHGGGNNHRMRLDDGILIKDNHIAILRKEGKSLSDIVGLARQNSRESVNIEIEVANLKEVEEAVNAAADIIMLDNMTQKEIRQAVQMIKGKARIEASGGITLQNVRSVAETGVDIISIGALTHSVKALDISLKLK